MDEAVEKIGKNRIVQVVTDNVINYKFTGKLFMMKRYHLYWMSYAAHCIGLILEDITKEHELT
jgi:hypothetical protein